MTALEGIICLSSITTFLVVGWFLPRKLGVLGIFIAHFVISILTIAAIIFDFIRGVVPDPDFIWLIGNFIWVFIANLMLLPLSIFATYRYYIHKRKGNLSV
jgi:hypothetical protein